MTSVQWGRGARTARAGAAEAKSRGVRAPRLHLTAVSNVVLYGVAALSAAVLTAAEGSRGQSRSVVMAREGIVAAEQPLASQAGAMILAQGGNAIDAAVAANAVMSVVSPGMCGLGGDLFALVYEAKSGRLFGLNASGWSPSGLTPEFFRKQEMTEMPPVGIHAVTVPGCAEGWGKLLSRFGRKKFPDVLAAAIAYAEQGFPVSEHVAWGNSALLRQDPEAAKTFLPGGRPPAVGELFRNPQLAWALRQIAAEGPRAVYEGEIARRILATSQRLGGTMTAADLATYSAEWVEPIITTYRGWKVYEIPPNGQGIAALAMLNLMETFPLADYGHNSTRALHAMIEAKKLAYADMLRFVADPRFAQVPMAGMLAKDYARTRADLIDPARARDVAEAGRPPSPGSDTTYLCAVDSEGNIVSLIQSNYSEFGTRIVPEGCGFVLQNRGGLFSLDPASPNVVAPRKRPLHTIIPAFMEKGDIRIAFGIMNGWNQAQAHAQFVSNVVDFQLNLQAALEAPRFTKLTFAGRDVSLESRVSAEVRAALAAQGHVVTALGDFSGAVGGGQAVMRDFVRGVNFGASDPRKDGAAIPQPVGGPLLNGTGYHTLNPLKLGATQPGPTQLAASAAEPLGPGNAQRGEEIYRQNCLVCHQPDGKGSEQSGTPDYTLPGGPLGKTDAELIAVITDGKLPTPPAILPMPPLGNVLPPQAIRDVLAYVRREFKQAP